MKSVYFQKNLTYCDRKLFCFRCPKTNVCFCYTSLLFGLTNTPEEFQRFLEILTRFLNQISTNLLYLDDLIIQVPPLATRKKQKFVSLFLQIIAKTGLRTNTKCQLHPTTEIKWLGKCVNTYLHQVFPNEVKICQHMTTFWEIIQKMKSDFET